MAVLLTEWITPDKKLQLKKNSHPFMEIVRREQFRALLALRIDSGLSQQCNYCALCVSGSNSSQGNTSTLMKDSRIFIESLQTFGVQTND